MRRSLFIFVVLFFVVLSPAGWTGEKSDAGDESAKSISPIAVSMNDNWQFVMPLESDTGIGYLSGYGTTEVSGVFVEANLSLSPGFQFRKRLLQLALTLAYDSREALGFDLDERHPHGGMSLRFRPNKSIDMGIETDGGMRFRPGWIDLYQPIAGENNEFTGRYKRTDRNSYGHVGGELYFRYRFSKSYSGEMYGGHEYLNYFDDPGYSETDAPTHLVPGDRHRTRGGLQFTGVTPERFWRYSLDLRVENTQYLKSFARDAKTGYTHAAPGGLPANPKFHTVAFRARQRNSLKLIEDILQLVAVAQFTRTVDVFDNYYTSNNFAGNIDVKWTPTPRLELSVGYGITYERYTEDGYQAGEIPSDNHPPLDNGDAIRDELSHDADLRMEISVFRPNLKLFADGEVKKNMTNLPDYEPGIFPASSIYKINWDYLNWQLLCGLAFEM